jgi:hypothetical protein
LPNQGFYGGPFIKLFKSKLAAEAYAGEFKKNFGLKPDQIALLRSQVDLHLAPVIRAGEKFDLDKVLDRFNAILKAIHLSGNSIRKGNKI